MSAEFLTVNEDFSAYLHDETKTVGYADTISFPTSEEEIIAVLRTCRELGTHVTIQGNRTGLTAGCVPYGGHILSLERMNRAVGMRISEENTVYLRVQPGLSLVELNRMIATMQFDVCNWNAASLEAYKAFQKLPRQYFTPDPTEISASIGGMVSCNSSGAKTYRYGPTRCSVSALRLVLADGDVLALRRGEHFARGRNFTLVTEGGRTISGTLPDYTMPQCKNASGYYVADNMDLIDLIIGSDGTLGVLSEIEVKLIPLPSVIWGINCFFKTLEQSLDFVDTIKPLGLAAIELFDGHSLDILRAYHSGGMPVPPGFESLIYVEIHDNNADAALDTICAVCSAMEQVGGNSVNTSFAQSQHDRERLLALRHKVPESVNALIAERKRTCKVLAKVGSDMAVPDDKFREAIKMYIHDLNESNFEYAYWGHIGNNHLHINILPHNEEGMQAGKAMFARWAEKIVAMGGTVSAEHGIGKNKRNLLEILYGEEGLRQMVAVKTAFDPDGLLSRGNLFSEEYLLHEK